MERNSEYLGSEMNEETKKTSIEERLGIVEVELSSSEGLVFFAGCHCSNGNKVTAF